MMFYQPANNSKWTTASQRVLFGISLLLVLLALLPDQVRAGGRIYHCFTKLNESACDPGNNGYGHLYHTVDPATFSAGSDLTFRDLNFRLWAQKPNNSTWGIISQDPKYDDVSNAENSKNIDKDHIIVALKNPPRDLVKERYYQTQSNSPNLPLELTVTLKNEWLSTLLPGDYKAWIRINGFVFGGSVQHSYLYIYMPFTVPESLQITVPEKFSFGTFSEGFSSDSMRYKEQSVCAHAQGGAGFKIRTESRKGKDKYALVGEKTKEPIAYRVTFGPKNGNLTDIPHGATSSGFTGHIDVLCEGGQQDNMRLGITLESFESLSAKPADTYSDTLTLHIEQD